MFLANFCFLRQRKKKKKKKQERVRETELLSQIALENKLFAEY